MEGAKFSDYWFVDTRLAASDCGFQHMGTLYLGTTQSRRQLRIYDKAKQMAEKKGIALASERLRIEAQLRPAAVYRLAELPTAPNPFGSLLVISKCALSAKADNQLVASFLALSNMPGVSSQRAYTVSKDRKALREVLTECCPDWWKPGEKWAAFGESLEWVPQPHVSAAAPKSKEDKACSA